MNGKYVVSLYKFQVSMLKSVVTFILSILLIFVVFSCANRGNISGGIEDIIPPKIIKSVPENYTTDFNETEIKIYFDEYVKFKDLQKQLIISPPMDPMPEITPLGTASKYVKIKITDTLAPNTTYAFNFGNSIVDNNEENPFPYYRYVFSTGNYIDSLKVEGQISDAFLQKPDDYVSVMLYEVDSTLTDSVVFKKIPKYITNTLDSTTTFSIENIKAGKYMLVAMKDENQDNKFQPKNDKIAFIEDYINVPTDSIFALKLFSEVLDTKVIRPRLISGEKIAFGFEGNHENLKILIQSEVPEDFKYRITKDTKADSLYYWYTPRIKTDSLVFRVTNNDYNEEFTVKISEQKRDTLKVTAEPSGTINFNDDFKITSAVPFTSIDEQKINIINKDSVSVTFKTVLDSLSNSYVFKFDKQESEKYNIQLLPEAVTDFFGNKNDTLSYSLSTKSYSDYGNARVILHNVVYPVIVQITDDKGDVKSEIYSTKPEPIDFRNLETGDFYLRVVYDANKNGKYDTGNFLRKEQPERISYYKDKLEIRSNFDNIYDFTLL